MGLLDSFGQQPQQGGLLSQGFGQPAPQAQQAAAIPPEFLQKIQEMKSAPPEVQQEFVQKVMQGVQAAPNKTPQERQEFMQQFMQAMQG